MLLGRYINKYYKKYWYLFLFGIIALIAIDIVQLYEPRFLGQVVDMIASEGVTTVSDIAPICIKILIVAGVMFVGRMLWRYTLFNASQRIEAGLRHEMFLKSERLSRKYYHETSVGSVMAWFTTDLEAIEEFCGFGTVQLVDAAFQGILVIVNMLLLDWVMALFAIIPMILIIIWGALVEKFMQMKWMARQREYDRLHDFTQENFTGIRVIKAFVKETSELHAFAKVARKNRDANISFARTSVLFDVLIELIIATIMSMLIGFGSWFVFSYATGTPVMIFGHTIELSAGQLITFIGFFDILIWPMIALGFLVTMLSRAKGSLKRVTEFLDSREDIKNPENAHVLKDVKGSIEFRDLTFSYPGKNGEPTLKNISFSVEPGETIGIVGRIGSGKTTLVDTLLRLYNIDKKRVFIDGHDIMDCDIDSVRAAISYVPQDNFLFSDTISNNIAFSGEATDEKIREAAQFADVAENIESFRDGYGTVTGERGVILSGGQKQRVSIARAYLKDSPIMIMDDSVSAVDVDTEKRILENIRRARDGRTTLVIASRVSTVSHFSRILVLNQGCVEAYDTPENLMEISPTFKNMVYLQELEKEVEGKNGRV